MSKLLKLKSAKIAITLMLGVAMLSVGGTANAALTTDQVNAILALLNSFGADAATVANVSASLTGGTPVVSQPSSLNFGTVTLKVGSKGDYVKNLQTLVGAVADGNFGPITKAKVMAWQSANGLTADGVFGPVSRAKAMGGSTAVVTPPVVSNPTGPVAVVLSSDTPASGTVVTSATSSQAGVDLAHFVFTGSGTVTNLTLKRIGISSDSLLNDIYLYDGSTRLTDSSSVTSGSVITFNDPTGLFVVNGSRVISVRADLALTATTGETVGVQLTGYTASGQTAVVLSSPLSGNLMNTAGASLGAVAFGTVTPTANTALNPGLDIVGWQSTATITTRDAWLTRFAINVTGSVAKADLQNFRLIIGSTTVATVASADDDGFVTFVPATPYKMITGSSTFKVMVDVIGGASKNFTLKFKSKTDIGLVDSQYNVAFLASDTLSDLTGFQQTIIGGTMTVQKDVTSPSSTVVLSGTDVVLAKYKVTTYGEAVKADTLTVDFTSSNADAVLRNGRVLVDGQQVGSTANINRDADTTATDAGTAYNINYTFQPGTSMIEVRADVYAASGTALANGHTILISLYGDATLNNATGKVSGNTIDFPGAANIAANTLTVGVGTLTLAKNQGYGDQTAVLPATAVELARFTLTSGSNESINVDTITLALTGTGTPADDVTNVFVTYGTKTSSVKPIGAASQSWSVSETIAANATMTFKVFADLGTTLSTNTVISTLTVAGTTNSGTTASTGAVVGQTTTGATSGALSVYLDSTTPQAAQVVAGMTDSTGMLKLKLSGTNEDIYVKKVTLYADTTANSVAISSLDLMWSATSAGTYASVGTAQTISNDGTNPGSATWNLTGTGRVTVPANGSVYLKAVPTYVSSGEAAVSGLTPKLFLGTLEAEGVATLTAGGSALINSTGILVHANSTAVGGRSYVDSTFTDAAAIVAATATTITPNGGVFQPGDIIFVDNDGGSDWDPTTEELMVVLIDNGGTLTVTRGAFGTTATAMDADADKIYRLNNTIASATNAGIIGNAMTVLNTKLSVALKSDSPSGASNGASAMYVFGFTVSAANNSADTAANTATLTYVDITASKSSNASANVANMLLYPSEYDNNGTYVTTCVGLSATKWRCTLSSAGATNEIDENTSRSYVVRADIGFAANGNVKFSFAALGSSSTTLNLVAGNSVSWSDGLTATTTAQQWVNQATSIINGGQLSSVLASGTTETTAPVIASATLTSSGTTDDLVDAGDVILIVFSEMVDASTINTTMVPGGSAVEDVVATSTGTITMSTAGVVTVAGIATFDVSSGAGETAVTASTVDLSLNSTGKQLTITLASVTGAVALVDAKAPDTLADVAGTVKDMQGTALAGAAATDTTPTIAGGGTSGF
ncbi:hypothetical protein A3A01_01725 [Candidatus Nomurabacteria bacterium RIFCSPLOWO2_01_FULL_39_17]|uniref:Peptidoglycan binding-like domain-containing protein n=1 Tax=Candidatus Nomurabacteria bacterium RIFCSPLOWO2_01_FULL_39_17 TaxID=1801770 RepID=A0A1F6WW78_9BACT|nr:MAG: hypothetical protein A3A01_01725 [Candidatus Nomurabacteria bacterium RIFCSPLOWO2_01_FULL_39_17]